MRTAGARAAALALAALAALAAGPAPRALAAEAGPAAADGAGDRILDARLEAGWVATGTDGDRSLLFPYDPLGDGPILGFGLLNLSPSFGSLNLEAAYLDGDSWRVSAEYGHGSDVRVGVAGDAFTHARRHEAPVEPTRGAIAIRGGDEDPGRAYRDEHREASASLRLRAPGYPAHLTASGRVDRREGARQMPFFFRSCSAAPTGCHVRSRSRELDEETREYTVGADAHAGPVDIAYAHTARTYRDDAPDPLVAVGDLRGGLPPGEYPHDVNPDVRSSSDQVTLNTNLTNRAVLSASYTGGEQENETSGVGRRLRTAGAAVSWRVAPTLLVLGRYAYDEERSADLSAEALALRERRNEGHATLDHGHAVRPERTRHTAELSSRLSPARGLDVGLRVRHRALERLGVLEREDGTLAEDPASTRTTLAGADARWRLPAGFAVDAAAAREWTDGPVYAVETTGVVRAGVGATWAPGAAFLARASWQGFRGRNDDAAALEAGWPAAPGDGRSPERTVTGDAYTVTAAWTPAAAFSLAATWSLLRNGVEQDLVFGSPATAGYWFASDDTAWSGRVQLVDLKARWAPGRRFALTAEAVWVDSLESYAPTFAEGAGLEEAGRAEFTKVLASLQGEVRITGPVGLTVGAFWARYDDQADDAGDGTAKGVLTALNVRW